MENSQQSSALFPFILVAKDWPFVISCQGNGIIFIFRFTGYLPSYHLSQSLHHYDYKQSFLILLHRSLSFHNFPAFVYETYMFSAVLILLMIFAEIPFCPLINSEQPIMVLVIFLMYQLSCGMRYLILSVPLSLLVLKENPRPHFVQRLFFLTKMSLNFVYLVMYL